jgi:hypothetical protein
MSVRPVIIPGVVRGGVVHPEGGTPLPEGARVEIVLSTPPPPPPPPPEDIPEAATPADQWEREE